MDFKPKIYDPKTAPDYDEGLFYDGELLCSITIYWCDDDVDYFGGYIGCLTSFYDPEDLDAYQFGDGLWTGYKTIAECLEGEWHTDGVVRLSHDGYDCCTTQDLIGEMLADGASRKDLIAAADELLAKVKE